MASLDALAQRPGRHLLAGGASLVTAATIVVGLTVRHLGTPLPPFLVLWRPEAGPLAWASVALPTGAALAAPIIINRIRRPAAFGVAVLALALVVGLSVNLARTGLSGWSSAFAGSHEAANEYLPGLPALSHGAAHYLRHFAQLIPYLPVHVRGNPPGPLVALKLLGIHTLLSLTALVIAMGALSAPLTYDLGRTVGGEARGRCAAVLAAFAPSLVLFGVTSADYAFMTLGLLAACLLIRYGRAAGAAGAAAAAVGSLFSWLLLAIPAWAAILVLRRDGPRRALAVALSSGLAILALHAALALATGYDPIAVLRATTAAYRHGVSAARPYAYWVAGSPVAWLVMLGLPTAWLAARSLLAGDDAAVALAAIVAIASLLGFTKAETERIWLPFVPLACVAAAGWLPARRVRLVLLSLAAQAVAVELLFDTVW